MKPARVEHTDVGAYALGVLEEPDRSAFEAHLADCARCAAELAELSGLRDVLAEVEPADVGVEAPTAPTARRRPWDLVAAAAIAAALLLGGVLIGASVAGQDGVTGQTSVGQNSGDHVHGPASQLLLYGERFAATDPATGVTGVLGVESRGFGSHVALELRGVHGPQRCTLTVVSRTGARETAASWGVPDRGYGVPGAPDPLLIHGATSIPRGDIARFEVTTADRTLLSVTVPA